MWDEPFLLGGRALGSRLILGAGKYPSVEVMRRCHEVSGTEMVTVAVRGIELSRQAGSVLDHIDSARIALLPSTAGCRTADEAVRTAYLAREAGFGELLKLEVSGDERTLLPDVQALLDATATLVREGFVVLPTTNDDPVGARRLADTGAAAIMPLGAPIGSGMGMCNPYAIRMLLESLTIPVIVAAGLGTASDAARAMELGCHGVLVETGIACATDPEAMAEAMKLAVQAGRLAYRAGRIPRKLDTTASVTPPGAPDWAGLS